jgi:hypothetical protein
VTAGARCLPGYLPPVSADKLPDHAGQPYGSLRTRGLGTHHAFHATLSRRAER